MAEQKRDYYEVLGVDKNADDAAIKTQIDALQNTSIVLTSQNSDVSRFEKMGNDIASGVVKHTVVEQPVEENSTSNE